MKMQKINQTSFDSWKEYYFEYQYKLAEQYYIPLLKKINIELENQKIFDVGCGNGGFISAFSDYSTNLYAIEIKEFDWDKKTKDRVNFLIGDLTEMTAKKVAIIGGSVDLIILRDVIEHIPPGKK